MVKLTVTASEVRNEVAAVEPFLVDKLQGLGMGSEKDQQDLQVLT